MTPKQDSETFGLSVALAIPFGSDGGIAFRRLTEHAAWCLKSGCRSVTVFGTTGEGASFDLAERERVLGALAGSGIAPGRQVVACVVATSVRGAASQLRQIYDFGCRTALLLPPFYYTQPDEEGLFGWFAGVLERGGTKLGNAIIYNIPSVTNVPISPELVARLRDAFPGMIAGVKDSSGDAGCAERMLAAHGDIAILVGDERLLAAAVRRGAQGSISGLANVCPAVLRTLIKTGNDHSGVVDLVDEIVRHPVTPAVKALIAHRTADTDWRNVRPPLSSIDEAASARLGAVYDMHFGESAS